MGQYSVNSQGRDPYSSVGIPEVEEPESFIDKFKAYSDRRKNQVSPPPEGRERRRFGQKVSGLLEAGKGLIGRLLGRGETEGVPIDPTLGQPMTARESVRKVDVTSNDQVLQMQKLINASRQEGAPLIKEDGMLGPETVGAMRKIQGVGNVSPISIAAQSQPTTAQDAPIASQTPPEQSITAQSPPMENSTENMMTEAWNQKYGSQPGASYPSATPSGDDSVFGIPPGGRTDEANIANYFQGDQQGGQSVFGVQPGQTNNEGTVADYFGRDMQPPERGYFGGESGMFGSGTGIQNRLLGSLLNRLGIGR